MPSNSGKGVGPPAGHWYRVKKAHYPTWSLTTIHPETRLKAMNPDNPEEDERRTYPPGCLVKSELAEAVAASLVISLRDARCIVDVTFDSIRRALQSGDRVELRGFGIFGIRERRGRNGRNPKTGDPVAVPAKKVVFFALSRRLAKILNRI